MNNVIGNSSDFILEAVIPVFLFFLVIYVCIVIGNSTVVYAIVFNQNLHEPMYILLCNMSVCDLIGSTSLLPRVMTDLLAEVKVISFEPCVIQAFFVHLYGITSQLILTVMAYDRLPRCGTKILMFCNNSSLFSLSCVDTTLNNIYGLFITYLIICLSFATIVWTYSKILFACLTKSDNRNKRKAIHTCTTHLISYILYEFIVLFTIISQRYSFSNHEVRSVIAILIMIIPPLANPIIYGINTKEIRKSIFKIISNKILDY
uniref:G-protein coupled receptors family 1 profile domain-containing protein n=1 Tax=Erpetoichthys calabaricus TaxID=27687 RepID=A0A8C4RTL7_ERPCA